MDLPSPGSVFDLVVGAKVSVGRERVQRDLWSFWEVVDAIRLQPGLEDRFEAAAEAVGDMHAGDLGGACAKLRALVAEEADRDHNSRHDLRGALETLDRISPRIEATEPAGPRP
ncbi:hypothetical protein [Methylobacterium fujisawaense]|jgi:hypothetical protein